jgi:hypothetical protein
MRKAFDGNRIHASIPGALRSTLPSTTSIGSSPTTAPATALDAAQRDGEEPLTAAERDELTRLRRQLAE